MFCISYAIHFLAFNCPHSSPKVSSPLPQKKVMERCLLHLSSTAYNRNVYPLQIPLRFLLKHHGSSDDYRGIDECRLVHDCVKNTKYVFMQRNEETYFLLGFMWTFFPGFFIHVIRCIRSFVMPAMLSGWLMLKRRYSFRLP